MRLKPRFIFHANASALGGRVVKPRDVVIETPAASSLPAVGGRSRSKAGRGRVGNVVSYGSASTLAEGLFDDLDDLADVLCRDGCEDTLTATMRVQAEVRNVTLGMNPVFTARRVSGGFTATSAKASGEPSIKVSSETGIDGAALGRHKLIVELNTKLFQQHDTLSKLRSAADDPKFVRDRGKGLFLHTAVEGPTVASPEGRLVEPGGTIYGTIVKSIRWADKPYPGAVIDHNVIHLPDCGDIYFGEILISGLARRLTMLRFNLCCPAPMMMMMSDTEDNGTWGV